MPFLSGDTIPAKGKGSFLTPKQAEWLDLYMIHKNATTASELSSYSTTNPARHGSELLHHPLIKREIEKRLAQRSMKAEIKAEYLISKLMQIIERDGDEKTADILRAIELAGKSIALWKERQEISGPDGEAIKHEQHVKESVADFTSRISSLAKRAGTDNVVELPVRSREGGA